MIVKLDSEQIQLILDHQQANGRVVDYRKLRAWRNHIHKMRIEIGRKINERN